MAIFFNSGRNNSVFVKQRKLIYLDNEKNILMSFIIRLIGYAPSPYSLRGEPTPPPRGLGGINLPLLLKEGRPGG